MKKEWWQGKVAYQIYPKSFKDTNGDGIGDIRGIIEKLDYLQDLGVDIIWISPVYQSPLADQGYDISDYSRIDPRFGTMEDMDELIREAKSRHMHILMDLVVNHCSDKHEWFRKALQDPYGRYGKYFYIEKAADGKLPCNWRSYFGGPVWEKLPGCDDLYYLHLFHKKQPDLNWENPELREEIYRMINSWLDRGLSGFRLDAIINIKKLLPFRDFPADRPDGLSDIRNMVRSAEGVGAFLSEMRDRTFRPHHALSVGEVFSEKKDELPDFIGENGYFSSIFDFRASVCGQSRKGWYDSIPVTPDMYRDACFESQKQAEGVGFLSTIIENHDQPRGVSRYIPQEDLCDDTKKVLAAVSFMLRGLPFIYQGQEIGMENIPFSSIAEADDVSSHAEYETALRAGCTPAEALRAVALYSRDNARTPFQWNGSEHAGFTDGTPWLRVNPDFHDINLEAEAKDPDSVFSFYRQLTALRKDPDYAETIVYGSLVPYLNDRHNLMCYFRKSAGQTLFVAGNFGRTGQRIPLGRPVKKVLLNNQKTLDAGADGITLAAYQAVILEL